jgi:rhodanese-related sulfurtransferase
MPRETDPVGADELARAGAVLLDVRDPAEYAAGHAPGAINVPLAELGARLDDVPSHGTVVCVCGGGGRSASATELLGVAGRDAINLAGGMRAWASEGLPVVTDDGASGSVG